MADKMPDTAASAQYRNGDKVPRWGVETWIAVIAAVAGLTTTGGKLYVVADHVAQLEAWRDKHTEDQEHNRAAFESRLSSMENNSRNSETTVDHRLTVVEGQTADIINRLQRIEDKLDKRQR